MKRSINLMTDEAQRAGVLREARRFWMRVLGGTLILLIGCGFLEWRISQSTSRQVAALRMQYAPIQSLKNECITMRGEMSTLREAQQLTLRLVDLHPVVTLLGTISNAISKTGGDVFIEKLVLNNDHLHDSAESSGPGQRVTLQGSGPTNLSIAQFTDALRASGLFQNVTLHSSESNNQHTSTARSFHLNCQL